MVMRKPWNIIPTASHGRRTGHFNRIIGSGAWNNRFPPVAGAGPQVPNLQKPYTPSWGFIGVVTIRYPVSPSAGRALGILHLVGLNRFFTIYSYCSCRLKKKVLTENEKWMDSITEKKFLTR
jgi:hypothetical protein